MKKLFVSTFLSLAFVFLIGDFYRIKAQTFSGSIGTVRRGGSVKGTIVMKIPGGLHVNSNQPTSEFAIPTVVKIRARGAKIGNIVYPRGKNRKFDFSEDNFNVYENRNAFTFNLIVPANFKGKIVRVNAVVNYQACTNEVCYPPATKKITLTANVK